MRRLGIAHLETAAVDAGRGLFAFVVLTVALLAPTVAAGITPHGGYDADSAICGSCHVPHEAVTERYLFSAEASAGAAGEIAVCYSCHDGSGASTNVKNGVANSFALASGHTLENSALSHGDHDLTDRCSSCHSPHLDPAAQPRLPRPSIVTSSGTYAVTGADNTWCFACHNDTQDWHASTTETAYPYPASPLPSSVKPTRDAAGYPVLGTYPGKSVYEDPARNGHASIPAGYVTDPMVPSQTATRVAGDCLWCHASHRGVSTYDGLLDEFRPSTPATVVDDQTNGTYAAACLSCHGGGSWEATGAANVKQFVTAGGERSGHRIKTSGGTLPVGAPLPCYECHNPHGSKSGNTMLITDALGGSLEPTTAAGAAADAEVRRFCFTCHTTDDTAKGWDSDLNDDGVHTDGAYVAVTGQTVVGLARDAAVGANVLRLPVVSGHSEADSQSCYQCHGRDYSPGGYNVHNPTGGVSAGGVACYGCHGEYEEHMEFTGGSRTLTYHHVLGTATYAGDEAAAFWQDTYPTAGTAAAAANVYCLSCHVDHDKFNDTPGANLRGSMAGAPTAAATDFNSSTGGVCLGCHDKALTKDYSNQKDDGSRTTPIITTGMYAGKAHDYVVNSYFGPSADAGNRFQANCVKCHNDEQSKPFQEAAGSAFTFGTHFSAQRRVIAALGGTFSDPAEEGFCFRCHGVSGLTGEDYYAAALMNSASQYVYTQINSRAYTHGVDNPTWAARHLPDENQTYISANKHVECEDCHNPHAAGKVTHNEAAGSGIGSNAINQANSPLAGVQGLSVTLPSTNWTAPALGAYTPGTATKEYEICLKCHSGANTALTTWDATWTDVALEFNPANNSSHPVMGPHPVTDGDPTKNSSRLVNGQLATVWEVPAGQPSKTMYCSDCHGDSVGTPAAMGPHGSAVPHLLKGPREYWPTKSDGTTLWKLSDIASQEAEADLFCMNCHENAVRNEIHGKGGHKGYACVTCHILVPHGGKVSRLLGDSEAGSQMPTRYNYGGNSIMIWGFRKPSDPTNNAYGSKSANCYVNSGVCGTHASSGTVNEHW
ncbi:MAG: hypothetical protein Kow0067_06820 [Coriobacteriia bacterium]